MSAAPVNGADHDRNRHFAANMIETLREDYRLRVDEAERALGLFLRRNAGWATPDQAAFEAYRWWAATVDPSVVTAREAEQRAHAHPAGDPDTDRAAAPVEREAGEDDADRPRNAAVQADLAATESALAMIRDQGQRHGFTPDQVELARHLRLVLDESPVWDSITPGDHAPTSMSERVDLEPALQPDTVRERDDHDDLIVIDAMFAGITVTVLHQPGGLGPANSHVFCEGPAGRGTLDVADVTRIGMIAAGDRTPDPGRIIEYDNLGRQVRNHLMGLAEAVDQSREAMREQRARRLNAATTAPDTRIGTAPRGTQPTLGSTR